MKKKTKLTKLEQSYAQPDTMHVLAQVATEKTYLYRLVNPCPICDVWDTHIITSANPHKTRITPFHEDDLMPLSCGHSIPALNQPVVEVTEGEYYE